MSFHPSPSIDCHMTPMEIVMPLVQERAEETADQSSNAVSRPAGIRSRLTSGDLSKNPGHSISQVKIEMHMPLVQQPSEETTDQQPNAISRSVGTRSRRTSGDSSTSRGCFHYHASTGQYVLRCPPSSTNSATEDQMLWLSQIKTVAFYQALLGEFLGTMILTLVCTSVGLPIASKSVPDLNGALAVGFTIATMILAFGHISGSHINPAVTVSFLVACQIDGLRAFCYISMQLLGAVAGSSILQWLAPVKAQGNLGINMITHGVTILQAIAVEAIITFILCYTVHAICDTKREDIGGSKALAVGLAIIVGCLFGGPYTGASMNPARSFGPATVSNVWKDHWIYWVGPMTGAILASLTYNYVLRRRPQIIVRSNSQSQSNSKLKRNNRSDV